MWRMRASSVRAADAAVLKLTIGHRVLVPLISKMRVKIMKKLFYLGGILAAMLSLTNCAKEIDAPEVKDGYKMELAANSAVSKTWNENLKTVWGSTDALTVFYAEAGTDAYSENLKFDIVDSLEGRFECVLPEPLSGEVYDWYAQYPYSSYMKTPANTASGYLTVGSKTSATQLQKEANSMAHIAGENYPLFGKVAGVVVGETPHVVMSHATSLLEIVVKNQSSTPVNVSSLAFSAPEDIVGTYYIDFTGDELVYTPSGANYVSKVATLTVNPAVEVAAGESSKFYLAIKPFTAEAGATLGLALNGSDAKENTLAAAKAFDAGVINTLNYTVSADDVVAEKQEIVATVAEFIAAADGFNTYILTGKITSVANTTYGNFYLADETGEVYIYGLCSPEGEVKYWAESGVKLGDIITVKGSYTLYGTTHEMVNAIYVSHESVDEPEIPVDPETPGEPESPVEPELPSEGEEKVVNLTNTWTWDTGAKMYDGTTSPAQKGTINDVTYESILKFGTSSIYGSARVVLPAGTKKITYSAVAWKDKPCSLVITIGDEKYEQQLSANVGASSNPPYTIATTDADNYSLELNISTDTEISITTKTAPRALLWDLKAYVVE